VTHHRSPPGVAGFAPFIRSATLAGGTRSGWDVRQRVELDGDGSATARSILDELENGATSIWLDLSENPTAEAMDRALCGVQLDLAPIILDAGKLDPEFQTARAARELIRLWNDREVAPADARGSFGADPIGASASSGTVSAATDARDETMELARICSRRYPAVWTIVVDATRYHEAGASDAEEIACATATGVEYLRWLTEAGLNVEAALPQLEFRFAATADQFMTMAKLRAARGLWNRIGEVIGAPPDTRGQRQHAVTSRAMMTRYDPWTNLLRTAVACSAAGVAGASAITVVPYDYASGITASKLGRRLARNTHTILIEEAHLARVIDPAGGSWYVEALSDNLARAAWQWFAAIEGAGGMIEALSQRMVQERIAKTWSRRLQNIVCRRDPITGVGEFRTYRSRRSRFLSRHLTSLSVATTRCRSCATPPLSKSSVHAPNEHFTKALLLLRSFSQTWYRYRNTPLERRFARICSRPAESAPLSREPLNRLQLPGPLAKARRSLPVCAEPGSATPPRRGP
jgi:methylmalonyl-CoA mutase